MNANEDLIDNFYSAFKNKDWATMQACYADHATFSDAVFTNLNALAVRKMWEMLVKNGKDMELTFKDVWADDNKGRAYWEATYTFSRTGNKVVNKINASFTFKDGKITSHRDAFDFYTWAKQAFGITGRLIGWTPLFKRKIRKVAADNLAKYMATH